MENIIFIECIVEVHVIYLHSKYHVNLCISGVCWETTDAKLDDTNRGNRKKNDVEQEAVHPGLILFHWVESAAERQSDSELDIPFLNAPEHVETEVGEYKCSDEPCILLLKMDQKLVEPWDEWTISSIVFGNITKYSKLLSGVHLDEPQ